MHVVLAQQSGLPKCILVEIKVQNVGTYFLHINEMLVSSFILHICFCEFVPICKTAAHFFFFFFAFIKLCFEGVVSQPDVISGLKTANLSKFPPSVYGLKPEVWGRVGPDPPEELRVRASTPRYSTCKIRYKEKKLDVFVTFEPLAA